MSRPRLVRALAFVLLVTATASWRTALAQSELPAEIAREQAQAGATFTVLAGAVIDPVPDLPGLTLRRLTPATDGKPLDARVQGPELWYVEAGQLLVSGPDNVERAYQAGEQLTLSAAGDYRYRFAGETCASALRLELSASFLMEIGSDVAGPSFGVGETRCLPPATLFTSNDPKGTPTAPAYAFIARASWEPEALIFDRAFSGPVGFSVEAGAARLTGLPGTNVVLTPGSWAVIDGGLPHGEQSAGGAPATALLGGLISAVPPPAVGVQGMTYISPTYGYRLVWDERWSVVNEATADGADTLQLNNGVSDVYIQSFGAYAENAVACVDSLVAQLPTRPGYTNVEPLLTAAGEPVAGGDAGRAFAAHALPYTAEGGSPGDYVQYVECRALVPGQAVLVITHLAARAAYPGEIEPVRALLDAIVLA